MVAAKLTKVLHVTYSLDMRSGGPIRAITELSLGAESHGLKSFILGPAPFNMPDSRFPITAVHAVSNCSLGRYRYSRQFDDWLESNIRKFDGVVIHGLWHYPALAAYKAAKKYNIPYAWFPHGMFEPFPVFGQGVWKATKKVLYWLVRERLIAGGARAILFTTRREMQKAGELLRTDGVRRIVIPYGLHPPPPMSAAPVRQDLGRLMATHYCIFLGRLDPKKNIELLLRLWHEGNVPDHISLIIAGDGGKGYSAHLRQLAASGPSAPRIHFVGHVDGADKENLLRHALWFLLPSRQENFGIAVLEAVQSECAVAVSDEVYLSDYFPAGTEVIPVHYDDWRRFASERMADVNHRTQVRDLLVAALLPHFEISKVVHDWAEVFHELFARPRDPVPERTR